MDTIDKCLKAQHDDPEVEASCRKEIEDGFNSILENGGSYGDLEDLMLENGIDGEGIEDLLLAAI